MYHDRNTKYTGSCTAFDSVGFDLTAVTKKHYLLRRDVM
jgi:hypothetical protein